MKYNKKSYFEIYAQNNVRDRTRSAHQMLMTEVQLHLYRILKDGVKTIMQTIFFFF